MKAYSDFLIEKKLNIKEDPQQRYR